jgi:hypothetical protein
MATTPQQPGHWVTTNALAHLIHLAALLTAVPLLALSSAATAAPIGTVQTFDGDVTIDDFDDCIGCIVNGWWGTFLPDGGAGGAGDNAIRYDSEGFGFHEQTWTGYPNTDEAFIGDLLSAGVVSVQFDARNTGAGSGVFLRVFLFSDSFLFEAAYSQSGVEIPSTATEWATYSIPITADDLLLSPVNETFASVEDILSDIGTFGLRHDPGGEGPRSPDFVTAIVDFDNIQLVLVPLPAAVWLFGGALGLLGLAGRRRRQ